MFFWHILSCFLWAGIMSCFFCHILLVLTFLVSENNVLLSCQGFPSLTSVESNKGELVWNTTSERWKIYLILFYHFWVDNMWFMHISEYKIAIWVSQPTFLRLTNMTWRYFVKVGGGCNRFQIGWEFAFVLRFLNMKFPKSRFDWLNLCGILIFAQTSSYVSD